MEKEAFTNLLIKYVKKWVDNGYPIPTMSKHIKDNIHRFSIGSNNILAFIDEMLIYDQKAKRIKASEVYNCYRCWRDYRRSSADNREHDRQSFYTTIEDHFDGQLRPIDVPVKFWHNLTINPKRYDGRKFITDN